MGGTRREIEQVGGLICLHSLGYWAKFMANEACASASWLDCSWTVIEFCKWFSLWKMSIMGWVELMMILSTIKCLNHYDLSAWRDLHLFSALDHSVLQDWLRLTSSHELQVDLQQNVRLGFVRLTQFVNSLLFDSQNSSSVYGTEQVRKKFRNIATTGK